MLEVNFEYLQQINQYKSRMSDLTNYLISRLPSNDL